METLGNPRDKAALVRRLGSLRPGSPPCWGRMSAPQMICHLNDSFRGVMGERNLSRADSFFYRTLGKWIALYVPLSWPHGVKTRPEIDQGIGGTRPKDFHQD